MSRFSCGSRGAQIASLLRGAVAVAWFGIQTYLASVVLRVMLVAMVPSLRELDTNSILGLSTLGWASFVFLWIIQLVIVSFGMEMIRKYEAFAGPIILVTMAAIAADMHHWVTMRRAVSVARSKSFEAPVVIWCMKISSAMRPPKSTEIRFSKKSRSYE